MFKIKHNDLVSTREVGKRAEKIAAGYLLKQGYDILDYNWYCYAGELDLVCKRNSLIFVEVKSCTSLNFCQPYELFTYYKKKHLLRTIHCYILNKHYDVNDWQLDLITVVMSDRKATVKHYKNILLA